MNNWPDQEEHSEEAYEKMIMDKLHHMNEMRVEQLTIGEFNRPYQTVLQNIYEKLNDGSKRFWYNIRRRNIGTVKDRYVYEMDIFFTNETFVDFEKNMLQYYHHKVQAVLTTTKDTSVDHSAAMHE